jgi:hypothetical protein
MSGSMIKTLLAKEENKDAFASFTEFTPEQVEAKPSE